MTIFVCTYNKIYNKNVKAEFMESFLLSKKNGGRSDIFVTYEGTKKQQTTLTVLMK